MTGRLRELAARLRGFVTGRRFDRADVADELRFHREMLEARFRDGGADADSARRQAALLMGGQTQALERYGDQQSLPVLDTLLQDTRYALRTFGRAPAFTAAALLTLAIGIGGTTAVFSIVNAVLLRPLPYADPDRLVTVGDASGAPFATIGYTTIVDYRDRTRAFDRLVPVRAWQPTLVTGEAERLRGLRVGWDYFDMLGVPPALGRSFRRDEDHPDRSRIVVLSDGLWRGRFGADPGIVGRTVRMDGRDYRVVGVMPQAFDDIVSATLYDRAELWAPLGYDVSLSYACRSCQHLRAIGRLRPGVTPAQAGADLSRIRAELATTYPADYRQTTASVVRLREGVAGPVREPLLVLLGAVAFVLLMACANVANLLLTRGLGRQRELAVRAALGAGRGRLTRQLVTESLLLWLIGGLAGLGVGSLLLRALTNLAPADLPRMDTVALDRPVLLAAVAVSVVTGVLFGLLPALGATSSRLGRALGAHTRGAVGGASRRLRHGLVVVNLAVAVVLLAGAGLMIKSVGRLLAVDPGFDASGVITAQFSMVGDAYREDTAVYAFMQRFLEEVRALPGVEAAAVAGQIPMGGNGDRYSLTIEGVERPPSAAPPSPERYSVTPGYFHVMRIPLLEGRLIDDTDTPTSEPVMLVSSTAARTLFDGGAVIGRHARVGGSPDAPWRTIVGVVGDVRHADLAETVRPQMYLPQAQFTDSFVVLTARVGRGDPADLVPAARRSLHALDPRVPLYDIAPLDALLARSTAQRRFVMLLLVGFAGVALLLAAVGLYGVVSYTVASRTREVGLRVALGATRAHVLGLVLGAAAWTVAAGLVAGLLAALAFMRLLEGQLYGIAPLDPSTLGTAALVLAGVAAAAHAAPLRRALAVDPTVALRDE